MMTPEEAKRVIQSHKFLENHYIYGVAKQKANRAINEVDKNIENHTFMNNYIEKKYGYNMTGGSNSNPSTPSHMGARPTYPAPAAATNGNLCGHHYNQQQQVKYNIWQPHSVGGGGDGRKYGVFQYNGFMTNQKR